jgi:hypothetical protein
VAEALGVVENRNHRRGYAEEPDLVRARNLHLQRRRIGVLQRKQAEDLLRFGPIGDRIQVATLIYSRARCEVVPLRVREEL